MTRDSDLRLPSPPRFEGLTLATARRQLAALLAAAGRDPAPIDARLLVEQATGLDHAGTLRQAETLLPPLAAAILRENARRRLAGEPLSRIIGTREFCGLPLQVRPDVLDPREDSEAVVRLARDLLPPEGVTRLLDLGTGSGALLCALLSAFPGAYGVGVDYADAACEAAASNLSRCGLGPRGAIVRADWSAPLAGGFDLIVSNPPYIATADLAALPDEVRNHDPHLALDGGPDGLDLYRAILRDVKRIAPPAALLIFEIGAGALSRVADLATASGLVVEKMAYDNGGHVRALALRCP